MTARLTATAALFAICAAAPAHAGPDLREAIHAATSQAIATQGNRALRVIRDETLRIFKPALPEPAKRPDTQAATDSTNSDA